ncbi:MAG: D-alanyl-D-alanine carboxypeptidase family protein [Fibrobacterota bacterium]|nr:MAG: D-alanyl-D-alanine carboxypeptidase family protein [Fibrobacterota bacterium]
MKFSPPAASTHDAVLLGTIDAQEFIASSTSPPGAFGSFTAVQQIPYESIDPDWLQTQIDNGWPDIPFAMRAQHWTIDWGVDTGKIVLLRYRANNFKRGRPPANPNGELYQFNQGLFPWYLNSLYPGGIREATGIFVGDQITSNTGTRIAGTVHQENRIIFNGNPDHEIWSFEGEDTIRYSDFKGPAEVLIQNSMTNCPGNPPTASFEYSLRAVSDCKLLPFTPMTDPNALLVEEGQTPVLMQGLTPQLLASYQCLDQAVKAAGGALTVNSAVRPPQYQNHLYEVRQNKLRLDTLGTDTSGCQSILPEVRREWNKHKPGVTGKTSKHSLGKAIDMNWSPASIDIATLSRNCGLRRPLLNWKVMPEPWHFEN